MATTRRADMFTEDGKPSPDDPREHRPRLGDERTTLVESLRCRRLMLEMKCAGLDAEAMARRPIEPSTMSLLGLVRHLAEMERATFRVLMAGQDVPKLYTSDRDGYFDGAVSDPQVASQAWEAWHAEVAFSTGGWRRRLELLCVPKFEVDLECSGGPSEPGIVDVAVNVSVDGGQRGT